MTFDQPLSVKLLKSIKSWLFLKSLLFFFNVLKIIFHIVDDKVINLARNVALTSISWCIYLE